MYLPMITRTGGAPEGRHPALQHPVPLRVLQHPVHRLPVLLPLVL